MEKDTSKIASAHEAFYLVPKNGGFQIRRLTIEEDVVLSDEPFSDPDAWDQVMSMIEQEMSKKFQ